MLSKVFLIKQGKCCGNGCLMCPYDDKHSGVSSTIREEVLSSLEPWEFEELNKDPNHNIIIKKKEGPDNNKPL
tara:strand:+ start:302 stop:520 length:219 start_codon:yes stop_codon:yes gene_type:complete